MRCTRIPGGFICGSAPRRRACKTPGCTGAVVAECDYPVKGRKSGTCDATMCERCRTMVSKDVDYCPPHWRLVDRSPR